MTEKTTLPQHCERQRPTDALGSLGEDAAERFLTQRGLRLLDRNWRDGNRGELDLIFHDGQQVVFVEVKTRRGLQQGDVLEAVDTRKLARLKRLAAAWMAAGERWQSYRIDVVAVQPTGGSAQRARLTWLQGVDR